VQRGAGTPGASGILVNQVTLAQEMRR